MSALRGLLTVLFTALLAACFEVDRPAVSEADAVVPKAILGAWQQRGDAGDVWLVEQAGRGPWLHVYRFSLNKDHKDPQRRYAAAAAPLDQKTWLIQVAEVDELYLFVIRETEQGLMELGVANNDAARGRAQEVARRHGTTLQVSPFFPDRLTFTADSKSTPLLVFKSLLRAGALSPHEGAIGTVVRPGAAVEGAILRRKAQLDREIAEKTALSLRADVPVHDRMRALEFLSGMGDLVATAEYAARLKLGIGVEKADAEQAARLDATARAFGSLSSSRVYAQPDDQPEGRSPEVQALDLIEKVLREQKPRLDLMGADLAEHEAKLEQKTAELSEEKRKLLEMIGIRVLNASDVPTDEVRRRIETKLPQSHRQFMAAEKASIFVDDKLFRMESGHVACIGIAGFTRASQRGLLPSMPYAYGTKAHLHRRLAPGYAEQACRREAVFESIDELMKTPVATLQRRAARASDWTSSAGAETRRGTVVKAYGYTGDNLAEAVADSLSRADTQWLLDQRLSLVLFVDTFPADDQTVCYAEAGLAVRAPEGKNERIPNIKERYLLWRFRALDSEERRDCVEEAAIMAARAILAAPRNESGSLQGIELTGTRHR